MLEKFKKKKFKLKKNQNFIRNRFLNYFFLINILIIINNFKKIFINSTIISFINQFFPFYFILLVPSR